MRDLRFGMIQPRPKITEHSDGKIGAKTQHLVSAFAQSVYDRPFQPDSMTTSRLSNPVLFTQEFSVPAAALNAADLLDPILNADTRLFVDPLLIPRSANSVIIRDAAPRLDKHLRNLMRMAALASDPSDPAWKGAMRLLNIDEVPETCLGFGVSTTSGSDRAQSIRHKIVSTAVQIMKLGIKDPEAVALMSFIEEGIGPDTISDLTTNIIKLDLARLTEEFCKQHNIKTAQAKIEGQKFDLPMNRHATRLRPILLVPKDIIQELPVAADWSDIDRVMKHNLDLRAQVNAILADYAKATITEKKQAIREAALKSATDFVSVFGAALSGEANAYDFKADPKGFEALRTILRDVADAFPLSIVKPKSKNATELRRVVAAIIAHFKQLIENNDLSDLLWDGSSPRHERAAQHVFFGIADSYCRANDLDISPETNAGGGPVDFKFSTGYANRLLVEVKLSTGRVVHGYERQIEVYAAASAPDHSVLLVVRVGTQKQLDSKLKRVAQIEARRTKAGFRVPELIVVDGTKKPSASKR